MSRSAYFEVLYFSVKKHFAGYVVMSLDVAFFSTAAVAPSAQHLVVFDIVYDRCDTELVRQAKRSGCRTIRGTEMLLYQAAAAFELWTGVKAPVDTMRDSLVSFGFSR